jgi:hypothetical protein
MDHATKLNLLVRAQRRREELALKRELMKQKAEEDNRKAEEAKIREEERIIQEREDTLDLIAELREKSEYFKPRNVDEL